MSTKKTKTQPAELTFEEDLTQTCEDLVGYVVDTAGWDITVTLESLLHRHPMANWGTPDVADKIAEHLRTVVNEVHGRLVDQWSVTRIEVEKL